jgi:hypothetical protein
MVKMKVKKWKKFKKHKRKDQPHYEASEIAHGEICSTGKRGLSEAGLSV